MRVLVLGVYREPSGHGAAVANTIAALHEAGADVACRPIQYTPGRETAPPLLKELERKSFPGPPDVTLQYAPPYAFQYCKSGGLNVGAFFAETSPLPYSWAARANLMDLVVAPNAEMAAGLPSRFFAKPVAVAGVPQDPARYAASYPVPGCLERARLGGRFVIYSVGEWCKRKNAMGLLRAYFAEFAAHEPVTLLLKTGVAGLSPAEAKAVVEKDIGLVKKGCKLTLVPRVEVVTERLTEAELCGLHQHADLFAQPSHAECWSMPAFDALGFGSTPVVTAAGGFLEYVSDENGWRVSSQPGFAFNEGDTHAELFTGRRVWEEPNLPELAAAMRWAFEDPAATGARRANRHASLDKFSTLSVGRSLLATFAKALARAV